MSFLWTSIIGSLVSSSISSWSFVVTGHLVGEFESSTTTWLNWKTIKEQHSPIQRVSLPVLSKTTLSTNLSGISCLATCLFPNLQYNDNHRLSSPVDLKSECLCFLVHQLQ